MADFDTILKTTFDVNTDEIFAKLDTFELTEAQKGVLATSIVLERIGSVKRTFSYAHPLAASDDDCAPTFARSFIHTDWEDGEDVVSAQGSNGDEGFNARFHKIEADLDALSTDIAKNFECLGELRSDLATLLEEIKLELNRINTDIQSLKPKSGGVTLPPVVFPPEVIFPPINVGPRRPIGSFDPRGPLINPGLIDPINPFIFPVSIGGFHGVVPGAPATHPAIAGVDNPGTVWTSREDPNVGIIAGMRATRVTEGVFNGTKVELWNTPLGTVLTPITALGAAPQGFIDPRLEMTGRVGAWSVANADTVKDRFGGNAFTKVDLEREFGNVDIGGGVTLKEALRGLNADSSFADVDELVDGIASAQATAIINAGAATVASIGSVGLHVGDVRPEASSVDVFAAASPEERAALSAAGIDTVSKLASANPDELAVALSAPAGSTDAGRLAAGRLRGIALAVGRLRP
ncbi:hypothetical protein [Sinorhizobium meliloti]|uniref:Uncharacterized protein n=1 Tax=Rhizobium meliloti TaxID=382 RepID=A0A2J0YT14_RHIML|nr:hypothetical protein [Sinorhizobium meliloti]PJR08736.1 hypothetical protein CEJ86_32470 [Sinorhizobium meliloti]